MRKLVLVLTGCLVLAPQGVPAAEPLIVAHRGVHQTYSRERLEPHTCTAERIFEPTHRYLENTLPSMAAAFRLGADVVEIDVHATSDGRAVVFHDWTLPCRTNGVGTVERQTLAYLRSLDIGYGYTADDHQTHPFRCRPGSAGYRACLARNRMPTLEEVLLAFPGQRLALNMKSGSMRALGTIVSELRRIETEHDQDLSRILFYCSKQSILDEARRRLPAMTIPRLGRTGRNKCLRGYFTSGRFGPGCSRADYALPFETFHSLTPAAAEKLVDAVHRIDGRIAVIRVDTRKAFRHVQPFGLDAVWTDRIEVIGKACFSSGPNPATMEGELLPRGGVP